ncbi:hypothetical protein NCC49_002593 [Naganishia albida]|nr:hypothetical protein NCC49_002593 [Naganishia albida]
MAEKIRTEKLAQMKPSIPRRVIDSQIKIARRHSAKEVVLICKEENISKWEALLDTGIADGKGVHRKTIFSSDFTGTPPSVIASTTDGSRQPPIFADEAPSKASAMKSSDKGWSLPLIDRSIPPSNNFADEPNLSELASLAQIERKAYGPVPKNLWTVTDLSSSEGPAKQALWPTSILVEKTTISKAWINRKVAGAKRGEKYKDIEIRFYTPDDRKVTLIARRDLGNAGGTECYECEAPIGGFRHRFLRDSSPTKMPQSPATQSVGSSFEVISSTLETKKGPADAGLVSMSTTTSVRLPDSVYAEILQAVHVTPRAKSEGRLSTEIYTIERRSLNPSYTVALEEESQAFPDYDAMWNGLQPQEQAALTNSERSNLRSILTSGTEFEMDLAGRLKILIRKVSISFSEYVEVAKDSGYTPELIVGELRRLANTRSRRDGAGSWTCYKYRLIAEGEATIFHGFALDVDKVARDTGISETEVLAQLPRDGMQAIFIDAKEKDWFIRRIGWHGNDKPWAEEDY